VRTPIDSQKFNGAYFLEVVYGSDTLAPRVELAAAPYAIRARYVDSVATADSARVSHDADLAGHALYADSSRGAFIADTAGHALWADTSARALYADSLSSGSTRFADSARASYFSTESDSAKKQLWRVDTSGYVRLSTPFESYPVLIGTSSPSSFPMTGRLSVLGSPGDQTAMQFTGPIDATAEAYGLRGVLVRSSENAHGIALGQVTSTSTSSKSATGYEFETISAYGTAYGIHGATVTSSHGAAEGMALDGVIASGSSAAPATGIELRRVQVTNGTAYGLNVKNVTSLSGDSSYGVYAENRSTSGTQFGLYGKVSGVATGYGVAAEGSGMAASGALTVVNGAVSVPASANQTAGTTGVVGPPAVGGLVTIPVLNNLVVANSRVVATVEGINGPVPQGTPSAVFVVSVSNVLPGTGFDLQVTRVPPTTAAAPAGGVRVHWWLINP
jgi:hypothetical protein